MKSYLREVSMRLERLSRTDRHLALTALEAQLSELQDAGVEPAQALGAPEDYAEALFDALSDDTSAEEPDLRVLGLPVETRGPVSAEVRSRTWNPENPHLLVPRLLGIGWTLNLGALAVKLGLIRPDDATIEVIERIPERAVRAAQLTPILIAGMAAGGLALRWRKLPRQVASGFDLLGRQNRTSSKRSLLGAVMLGVLPALWATGKHAPTEDRLVRAANATTLATASASIVAASILSSRQPLGRWGLIVPVALPLGAAASLYVIVAPLKAGLHRVWRTARAQTDAAKDNQ